MKKEELIGSAIRYAAGSPDNMIQKEYALSEDLAGVRMYEEPLFAFGAADDPLFCRLKDPEVLTPFYLTPKEWLENAQTVLSVFLPASDRVKISNRSDAGLPSSEWLHARMEGQQFINHFTVYVQEKLIASGANAVIPFQDPRYWTKAGKVTGSYPHAPVTEKNFISNWSERHTAYICGLGTFGLSRGLITKKGVAGRLTSIITDAYFEPDRRAYSALYEYCSKCGACAKRCPVAAISAEKGKAHPPCSDYLDEMLARFRPRYACGKCQTGVPCENGIPAKKKQKPPVEPGQP